MTYRWGLLELRPDDPFVHCTDRAFQVAATRPNRGVPVFDLGVPDARLDLIDDDPEAEFMNWPTGDRDARAGEFAEAMIARAGRP